MSIEAEANTPAEGENPAPEQEATAAPAPEQDPPATPEEPEEQPAKTFSQEELDEIVRKRLAREQRKWEREQTTRTAQPPQGDSQPPLPPADPDNPAEMQAYIHALAQQQAQEIVAQQRAQTEQAQLLDAYRDREEQALDKYDDFESVAYNPNLRVTDYMAQTIQASEIGPDVLYWLGSNPKEAARISQLPPLQQAREIGKVEAKLVDNPPVKKTTAAPPPINPVTPAGKGAKVVDTTDPRSIDTLSTSEWIEAERQRQIRAWEAKHRR